MPAVLVQIGYMVISWQAGVVFTRESLRAVGRMLPAAIALIVLLGVATAGFGVLLADIAGKTPLEGYLATIDAHAVVRAVAGRIGIEATFEIDLDAACRGLGRRS